MMLRLGSVEWRAILVNGALDGADLCRAMSTCKHIGNVLARDPRVLAALRWRTRVLAPPLPGLRAAAAAVVSSGPWKPVGARLFRAVYDMSVKISDQWHLGLPRARGFRLLASRTHVIALCDAYVIQKPEVDFFNLALYFEAVLGKQLCSARHWQTGKACLLGAHENDSMWEDCCALGVHRGNVFALQIQRSCLTQRFIKRLRIRIPELDVFVHTFGVSADLGNKKRPRGNSDHDGDDSTRK